MMLKQIVLILELKALDRDNNKPVTFPWWCIILGYILCGVCIANGVWWPYLYSIQWGSEVALEWLASLALSLFQSVLVIQPLKVRSCSSFCFILFDLLNNYIHHIFAMLSYRNYLLRTLFVRTRKDIVNQHFTANVDLQLY